MTSTPRAQDLRSFGVIRPAAQLLRPAGVRGGCRVVVYVAPDADVKRVEAVCDMHRKLEKPLYLRAVEIAEGLLLKTGSDKDTSYGAVVQAVKASGNVSNVPSVAEGVASILVEKCIRVWR